MINLQNSGYNPIYNIFKIIIYEADNIISIFIILKIPALIIFNEIIIKPIFLINIF